MSKKASISLEFSVFSFLAVNYFS